MGNINLTKTKRTKRQERLAKRRKSEGGPKFGWIQGVLVRCLLNIFGVMLFIRLSWVTGQAGIGLATVIILLSMVVTILSTLSMSAICTNGEVEGGGAYYMISRSLGPEFGGAIGIIFSLANAVAAAMYIVGFAETVVDLLQETEKAITGNPLHDIRIIGCCTAVVLLGILLIGMEWEAKAQLVLLVILLAAIVNFVVGTFIPPTKEKQDQGFVGYRAEVFATNFGPDFRKGEDFFSIFSVFFPAATGILAGANISGDLKNPQTAIPKGTLLAIILTGIVYILMAWLCGSALLRDAAGTARFLNDTLNNTTTMATTVTPLLLNGSTEAYPIPTCRASDSCKYGLENNYGAVGLASGFRPLILAGIFAATLSSALASLVGAPKVFQAVCKDKLFPGIFFFAKGYGKSNEPFRAYALAFLIAVGVACIAELNVIAPIISNFFLMAYTLINYSCFDASVAMSPGWRPSFKYYNKWLSLLGAILCLAVMFIINWWAALITFTIVAVLYVYVHHRKLGVNWGSSLQAHVYQDALKNTLKLNHTEEHVKNFRPQILVLSGEPQSRPDLVLFAAEITKRQSLLMCANIIQGSQEDSLDEQNSKESDEWLYRVKAFYCALNASNIRLGAQSLQQVAGLGKLKPNIVLLGYKSDWFSANRQTVQNYCKVIRDALSLERGVGVFRLSQGFDRKGSDSDKEENSNMNGSLENQAYSVDEEQHLDKAWKKQTKGEAVTISMSTLKEREKLGNPEFLRNQSEESFADVDADETNVFGKKTKQSGTIDVWWLFDDGGLTLLLPFILSQRSNWKHSTLRIFYVGSRLTRNKDRERMTTLLSKFRIDYSELTLLTDLGKLPEQESIDAFEELTKDWRATENEAVPSEGAINITAEEMKDFEKKTHRKIRLKELLDDHTTDDTNLIVMTLPIPETSMSTGLYMAWMEVLTRDMPPFLLLRGNQQNVLTFYS
ncbi:solute carrier family 12 member 2-like [Liolophura sinensis]|uniref:solute carrier family 12 member 2-like n=1 Tax=Liolophura sinensis TaxID=3198878 RepID=UPI0031590A34